MSVIFYQTKNDIDSELKHTKAIILNMLIITGILSIISFFVYKQLDNTNIVDIKNDTSISKPLNQ